MIEQDFICDYNCEHCNEENCIKYNTCDMAQEFKRHK